MPKMAPRWARKQNHPKGCSGCARAAESAKNEAIGNGLDRATATYERHGERHTVTVTRPKMKGV